MSDDSALRAEFEKFDSDGNGHIDEAEFAELAKALGCNLSRMEVAVALLAIDVNGNRKIEFGEFAAWWNKYRAQPA